MSHQGIFRQTAGFALALVLLAALGRQSVAQVPAIGGGTHVRVSTGGSSAIIDGTLFSQTADSLHLVSGGLVRAVPTSSVERIDVSSGRSHSAGAWHGAKVGSLIVGGLGTVIFGSAYATYDGPKQPSELVPLIVASVLNGAFYGAIIGGAIGRETWTRVDGNRTTVVLHRTTTGGPGVGIELRF